jgi:tetratricopeptide (TPR) repeat protein
MPRSLTPHDIAVADALGTLVDEAAQVRNVHDVTATVGQAGAYNDAHLLRGQCLHRLGKFDEAVDDYQRYLIKFPKGANGGGGGG